MKLTAQKIADGPGPNEVVLGIKTTSGSEEVVLSSRSYSNGTIEVGYPIAVKKDQSLVELPRESLSGLWRVWVQNIYLIEEPVSA